MEKLLNLCRKIQENFKKFYLGGESAIALKFNHRKSLDMDFFSFNPFSFPKLSFKIRKLFNVENEERGEDNLDFYIQGTKISFVFFPFKNLEKIEDFKGIKKISDYDIFLNKIYAGGRRIDWKDPYDIGFLYKTYRWDKRKIKDDFEKKFPGQSYEIFFRCNSKF